MTGRKTTKQWERLKKNLRQQEQPCHLCGQPIDYELQHPDPDSFSVDHLIPYIKNEELREDPGNLYAAHLRCNQVKGTRSAPPSLGNRSKNW